VSSTMSHGLLTALTGYEPVELIGHDVKLLLPEARERCFRRPSRTTTGPWLDLDDET